MFWLWLSNVLGVILSGVGSALLFFGTPPDRTIDEIKAAASDVVVYNYVHHPNHAEQKEKERRNALSRCGFGLMGIGFIFQLIGVFSQYPK